jgi:hypothetical protein
MRTRHVAKAVLPAPPESALLEARHIAAAFGVALCVVTGEKRVHRDSHHLTRFWKNLMTHGDKLLLVWRPPSLALAPVEYTVPLRVAPNNTGSRSLACVRTPRSLAGTRSIYWFPKEKCGPGALSPSVMALLLLSENPDFPHTFNFPAQLAETVTGHDKMVPLVNYTRRLAALETSTDTP